MKENKVFQFGGRWDFKKVKFLFNKMQILYVYLDALGYSFYYIVSLGKSFFSEFKKTVSKTNQEFICVFHFIILLV